jgi:PIN domain nuclease of toxin-antitoxin system
MNKAHSLILDTHAWVWLVNGASTLKAAAREAIDAAINDNKYIGIPAICVWEVCMLVAKGRLVPPQSVELWIEEALSLPGIRLIPLSPKIAVESCRLPGYPHKDPVDRLLIATTKVERAVLITRDLRIRRYARTGQIACLPA